MIKVLIAGDYCPQERISSLIEAGDYSFFEKIRDIISSVNYSIVNLECPIAIEGQDPIQKCGRNLKCHPKAIDALKYAGFNCVTLANNHLKDFGEDSVLTTLRELDSRKMDRVGGGETLQDSQKALLLSIEGKRIAIINFCENEFSIATPNGAGAAPIDLIENYRQIVESKVSADYTIVIVHGGHEMRQLPSPMMQKRYRWYVDIGADVVVNHHQHCFSGYEDYKGKPIIYGLGNFCFDKRTQRDSIWNEGYMVCLVFDSGVSLKLIPYQQCNDRPGVFPLEGGEIEEFNKTVLTLNSIINDQTSLEADFEEYCTLKKKSVLGLFSPFTNRYLRGAAQKGLIPFFLPKKKLAQIYDYINCEAHRDITLNCLHDLL